MADYLSSNDLMMLESNDLSVYYQPFRLRLLKRNGCTSEKKT